MRKILFLLSVLTCAFMVGCNNASEEKTSTTSDSTRFELDKARAFVEEDNAGFVDHFKKGDSVALADHYHSDGQFIMSNSEPVKKANLASAWGSVIRAGFKDFKLITHDLVGCDDLMVETGTYEFYGDNNKLMDKGTYVVTWKKENGKWKIYRDIAATAMPPAPAPAN